MRRLLRDPTLHFLIAGALVFAWSAWRSSSEPEPAMRIAVGQDQIGQIIDSFQRTWMRPPSQDELRGLIDDFITEEVLYREALALGLDQNDLVVRRRMRQKLEFLNDDLVELVEPSDDVLRTFFDHNEERFAQASRSTFTQIYFESDGADAALAAIKSKKLGNEEALALGDPTLLPAVVRTATDGEIAGIFGSEFAAALGSLPAGQWTGPIASSFGRHLVYLEQRLAADIPPFEEVRAIVLREWRADQRNQQRQRFYEELRSRYDIDVEMPEGSEG